MRLPWTSDSEREAEAQQWAERSFPDGPPKCAARVALMLRKSGTALDEIPLDAPLGKTEQFNELDHVQLLLAIEREFGLSILDEDTDALTTPAAIIDYVARRTPPETV